jgi:hypothetical protein
MEMSYESGLNAECIKERYVRVAAIIIVTIDGTKNNCVKETHKKITFVIGSTRKDIPSSKSLIFRTAPSSINMLQYATEEETKNTVHIQKKEQLRRKNGETP